MITNCPICTYRGAVFKVSDGSICLYCLEFLKKHTSYSDHDEISKLTTSELKIIIDMTRKSNENR